MIKRIALVIFTVMCFLIMPVSHAEDIMDITRQAGYTISEVNRPKASIVVDANTSDILWQDNIDIPEILPACPRCLLSMSYSKNLLKGKLPWTQR